MILQIRMAALIGSVLAEARTIAGINGRDLMNRTGVDESQISKYDKARVIPGIETARLLLDGCGFALAAVPSRDAATYTERDAVIAAARRFVAIARGDDASVPEGVALSRLFAAVNGLVDAEERGTPPNAEPHPAEELARLREQNSTFRDALKRAGDVIALVTGRSS